MKINQYEIYWIDLEPTRDSELQKVRQCVVISPNEMNHNINTIIIAPLTSTSKKYPTRIELDHEGRTSWVVLDQIRCVDKTRLVKRVGEINEEQITEIKKVIKEMLVD